MTRALWAIRLAILGTIMSAAVLGSVAATTAAATGSAAQTATGVHANEEFCKTMIRQFELFLQFTKAGPDKTKRAKYFSDTKELNATLVKTAPPSLASDIALHTRNANAMMDAQAAGNAANIKASTAALSSPESLTASKRMNDYCGIKPPSK